MKRYLITGGAGFIGSNFIRYLLEKYKEDIFIVNLDALTYAGSLTNLDSVSSKANYQFVHGNILDKKLLNSLFNKYCFNFVVNFAAESHVDRSISDPCIFTTTNILGTQSILDCCLHYWNSSNDTNHFEKYVQISTDEVYGSLGSEGLFEESTPLNPHSPYSASKASADLLTKAYCDTFGFPINITRCSNNYGPFQFPEKLIPLMINNALHGRQLPVYGDGCNVRDWLYVEDHCKAIDLICNMGCSGEVYNIGGLNEKKNIDIVKIIINELNNILEKDDPRKPYLNNDLIKFVTDRKGHDRRYAIDASKIKRELGWKPDVTFDDGIRSTIKWYVDNTNWLNTITSGEYKNYKPLEVTA